MSLVVLLLGWPGWIPNHSMGELIGDGLGVLDLDLVLLVSLYGFLGPSSRTPRRLPPSRPLGQDDPTGYRTVRLYGYSVPYMYKEAPEFIENRKQRTKLN